MRNFNKKAGRKALAAVLAGALAVSSVSVSAGEAHAQTLVTRQSATVQHITHGATPATIVTETQNFFNVDAIASGQIKAVADFQSAKHMVYGRVSDETDGSGYSSGNPVYLRWIDRDGQTSPLYTATTHSLGQSRGYYAFAVPDWVDATGRIHSFTAAPEQRVQLDAYVPYRHQASVRVIGYSQAQPYAFVAPRPGDRVDLRITSSGALHVSSDSEIAEFDSSQLPARAGQIAHALRWNNGNAQSLQFLAHNGEKVSYRWRNETEDRVEKSCSEERTVTNQDGTTSIVRLTQTELNRCATLQIPSYAQRGDVYSFEVLSNGTPITHESFIVTGALNDRDRYIFDADPELVTAQDKVQVRGRFNDGFDRYQKSFTARPPSGVSAEVDDASGTMSASLNANLSNATPDEFNLPVDVTFWSANGSTTSQKHFLLDTDGDGNADMYDPDDDGDGVIDSVEVGDDSNKKNPLSADTTITAQLPVGYQGGRYVARVDATKLPRNAQLSLMGLPAGLKYNAQAGVIEGTPTVTGSFPLRATAAANGTPIRNASGTPINQALGTLTISPAEVTSTVSTTATTTSTAPSPTVTRVTTVPSTVTSVATTTSTAPGHTSTVTPTSTVTSTPPTPTVTERTRLTSTLPRETSTVRAPQETTTATTTVTRETLATVTRVEDPRVVTETSTRTATVTPAPTPATTTRRSTATSTALSTTTVDRTTTATTAVNTTSTTTTTSVQFPEYTAEDLIIVRAGGRTSVSADRSDPTDEPFTAGEDNPEWATVYPSGEVDIAPPADVTPGQYWVTVVASTGERTIVPVSVAAPVPDAERYTARYATALGRRGHEATNFAPLFDVSARTFLYADQTAPAGTRFSSANAQVDEVTGRVTYRIPADAEVGSVVSARVTVTYPDGSASEVDAPFEVAEETLADTHAPRYVNGVTAGPGQRVKVAQVGLQRVSEIAEFTLAPDQDLRGWQVTIDEETGEIFATAPVPNPTPLDLKVQVLYADGSVDELNALVGVSDARLNSATAEPEFRDQVGGPGQTVRVPLTNTVPVGTLFDIADDGGLRATIDPRTGEISVELPADAPANAEYVIGVRATYPDGTSEVVPVKVGVRQQGSTGAAQSTQPAVAGQPAGAGQPKQAGVAGQSGQDRSSGSSDGPWWILILVAALGAIGAGAYYVSENQDQLREHFPQLPPLPRF